MTMDHKWIPQLFDGRAAARLGAALDFSGAGGETAVEDVEVLITGWGSAYVGERQLDAMPRLGAVLHAAGTLRGLVSPAVWDRGVLVTSAAEANAIPVAEYTLAMSLLAGKRTDDAVRRFRRSEDLEWSRSTGMGNYGAIVGVVGASRVGMRLIKLLQPFDIDVLVFDPTLDDGTEPAGSRRVGLDELLRSADVVSLHAPLIPATRGMIGRRELALMATGATLVNTARGGLVDHDALAEAVVTRRLHAVLDVTDPEPLPLDHPLRHVDQVVLTPHIAGSRGNEVRRLGDAVVEEAERLAAGLPPIGRVFAADLANRA
jgi:phosphoglycerate dehydrogenase-like enzyme